MSPLGGSSESQPSLGGSSAGAMAAAGPSRTGYWGPGGRALALALLAQGLGAMEVVRVTALTSTLPGAGMDSGGLLGWFNTGGEFYMQLCSGDRWGSGEFRV